MEGQMSIYDLVGSCGKMFAEPCQAEPRRERISESSLKKSVKSSTRMPLFLDLRTANGRMPDASFSTGGQLLGAYTIHSFGEQPNTLMAECGFPALPSGASVSRLSQILVDMAHPKYSLSAKACLGILNRAEKRGKALPMELKEALERQATP